MNDSLQAWAKEDEDDILNELTIDETLAQMSQMEKVKHLFINSPLGVCHNTFMEHYIPRFGALIWTLRHEHSWDIDTLECDLHKHKNRQVKYVFNGRKY